MVKQPSVRLQKGMHTQFKDNASHGNRINRIELGRVTKVNYQSNSVAFALLASDGNIERSSADDSYSAMLPMSMAGRNNYGKAYGDLTPVHKGDIVLIGFIDDRSYRPIVIGIYPDEAIAGELARSETNEIDPKAVLDYATADATYKVYPDQTYDFHDGEGTRVLSFAGHSFLKIESNKNNSGVTDNRADDGATPLDYADLLSSYLGNGELVEPYSDKAPEILLKHRGIVDANNNPDTHALYLFIGQDGTYRVSQMKTDEEWRTYFEIKNSEIHLVRQKNSKIFGGLDVDNLNSSSIQIDSDGNVTLRNHTTGIVIKDDGVYTLAGERLIGTKNVISDLIIDKLGSLGFGGANLFSKSTSRQGVYLNEKNEEVNMQGALVSDYIDCIGNNAYYTYAYAEHDVFDERVTLSLCVYDSDKKFLEGKEASDRANVQIATRALPADACYLRVSITNANVPIMLAFGADYSAYQPSYLDNKESKSKVSKTADDYKNDYLAMKARAADATNQRVLAMQNISEAVEDSKLTSADKQLLSSYITEIKDAYEDDLQYASNYDVNTDNYRQSYGQLIGRVSPILEDMTTAILVTGSQITDAYSNYFDARCNLTGKIENSSQSLYNDSMKTVNEAELNQNNSMLKQFTNVTQSLQSIMQTTKWTVWTDDLDLNEEKVTENLLFRGNHIKNSAVQGSQYIQVFAPLGARSVNEPSEVTQRVWATTDVTSYSRVLSTNGWTEWKLDSENNNYDNRLNSINNNLNYVSDQVSDLTSSTDSIKQQIQDSSVTLAQYRKANDTRVSNVESRVSSTESDINSNKIDISNLNATLISLSNTVSSLNKTAQNLTSSVNSINSSITDLKNRVATLESKVK